jgi:hypothetical protein
MGFFSRIFGKKKEEKKVGGMEDFMTLIRVYFQSAIAAQVGISNISMLPDLLAFKRSLKVATVNNKLGIGEKKACKKLMQDLYKIDDSFFNEIDGSIKKRCKKIQDVQNYMVMFQGYSQELVMLVGTLLKWRFRIPSFLKKAMKTMVTNTVHDILTKEVWKDEAQRKSAYSIRRYQQTLGFSEPWTVEYVYNFIVLAKREKPSKEDVAKAKDMMNKK